MKRLLGGHLGPEVSALVDGQLRPAQAERAWEHVLACGDCRSAVERETWVKNQLSLMARCDPPPPALKDVTLFARPRVGPTAVGGARDLPSGWAMVGELESRHRARRGGLIAAGAGTISAAVIGLAAASGMVDVAEPRSAETTIGGVPTRAPATAPAAARQQGPVPALHNDAP